jgi:hypothetical protein
LPPGNERKRDILLKKAIYINTRRSGLINPLPLHPALNACHKSF